MMDVPLVGFVDGAVRPLAAHDGERGVDDGDPRRQDGYQKRHERAERATAKSETTPSENPRSKAPESP